MATALVIECDKLKGLIGEEDLKAIDKEIKDIVNAAAEFAKESPEPSVDELWTDVYAEVS